MIVKKNDDFEWLRETFYAAMQPKELKTIDRWIDDGNLMLPSNTAEPGLYSLGRAPYQREILRRLSPEDPAQIVFLVFGSQLGKTTVELATMNYYISQTPCPIAFAFSDEGNLKNFVKNKFDPMLSANSSIKSLLRSEGRSSADSLNSKQFPGGFLKFLSGKSEASMRSDSVRVIIADEVDGMGTTKGGDVLSMLLKRTTTYGDNRKVCLSSTPLNDGVIYDYLLSSTHNKYFVRCPNCGESMLFELQNFRWKNEGANIIDAWMECPHCEHHIHNEDKIAMLKPENGAEWHETNPNAPKTRQGFYLNTFYAPVGWTSWREIAEEYYQAGFTEKGVDVDKMRTFYNTILGLPYKQGAETNDWRIKYEESLKSPYKRGDVPSWINFITTGSDVQGNRIETKIIGWGRRGRHLTIDYKVFMVPNDEDISLQNGEAWLNYQNEIINGQWEREDGLILKSIANALDSGYQPETVYALYQSLSPEEKSRFFPIKGSDTLTGYAPVKKTVKKAGFTGVNYWQVPVSVIKQSVFINLAEKDNEAGTKAFIPFFPCDFDQEFFMQIFSEVYVAKGRRMQWEKTRDRNEGLDTAVYNYAMFHLMGLAMLSDSDWDDIISAQADIAKNANTVKKPKARNRTRRRLSQGVQI